MKECCEQRYEMILEVQSCFFFLLCCYNDFTCIYKARPFNVLNINAKTMKYTLTTTVKHLVLFMCSIREVLPVCLNFTLGKLCEVGYKSKSVLEFSFLKRNTKSAIRQLTDLLVHFIWHLDVL